MFPISHGKGSNLHSVQGHTWCKGSPFPNLAQDLSVHSVMVLLCMEARVVRGREVKPGICHFPVLLLPGVCFFFLPFFCSFLPSSPLFLFLGNAGLVHDFDIRSCEVYKVKQLCALLILKPRHSPVSGWQLVTAKQSHCFLVHGALVTCWITRASHFKIASYVMQKNPRKTLTLAKPKFILVVCGAWGIHFLFS